MLPPSDLSLSPALDAARRFRGDFDIAAFTGSLTGWPGDIFLN
jgi:hypothetical protein